LKRYRLQPQKVSLPGPTDEIKIASYWRKSSIQT
jgi:hypothetical protein